MWHKYPKSKPRKEGLYLCIVQDGIDRKLRILQYKNRYEEKWLDNDRISMFRNYHCMSVVLDKAVWLIYDEDCEPTDNVIAWRKLPKIYQTKEQKK